MTPNPPRLLSIDPLKLSKLLWPDVYLYREQKQIIRSVWEDDQTFVPAGNMLGKDFVAGRIVVLFFLTRSPCRIVTTSTKDKHLNVLWGEIGQAIQTSKHPLESTRGGPIVCNHHELRKMVRGQRCPISYVLGLVASDATAESFQGHHCTPAPGSLEERWWQASGCPPLNLFVGDEASSLPESYNSMASTWARRMLVFGNTWECDNFFKHAMKGKPGTKDKGGDIARDSGKGFHRKVIHIKATASPNVRLALAEQKAGLEPSNRVVVPGVLTYEEYVKRRKLWDEIQQCVSLDAEFYEGVGVKLFPAEWLNHCEQRARELLGQPRQAKSIGIDPGEGSANTVMCCGDRLGLIEMVSRKTPNTADITKEAIVFMSKHGVLPEQVFFDRGGGGLQHACVLREKGYNVKTVFFGEKVAAELKPRGVISTLGVRKDVVEKRTAYKNRRAQMYGEASERCNPDNGTVYAIPERYTELRRQLAVMPKWYNDEGVLWLPPKSKKDKDDKTLTIEDLLGCSPDEADAFVLMVYGLTAKTIRQTAGAMML
jgi:hypothetical protein